MTAYDHPALDGVYKLSALRDEKDQWQYKLKLSEQAVKISNPGIYQVRRFLSNEQHVMDVMYDIEMVFLIMPAMVSLEAPHYKLKLAKYDASVDLLEPIFAKGKLVYRSETIHEIRERSRYIK